MNHLLESLRDLRALAELGESVGTEELRGLLSELRRVGEGLTRAELEAIQSELAALEALTAEQLDGIAQQLTKLSKGRAGIQGYNHLQAFHTAQRLSKRA